MVKPGYVGPFRARATVVGAGGPRVGVEATMTDEGNGAGSSPPRRRRSGESTTEASDRSRRVLVNMAVRRRQMEPFFDDPDHLAAGLIASVRTPGVGTVEHPGDVVPRRSAVRLDRAPPVLGEHTVEVLREVGLTEDQIEELLAVGAIVDGGGDR